MTDFASNDSFTRWGIAIFDVLTSKDHHLHRASELSMTQLRTSVARETQAFGVDALVMHDGTSHDAPGDPDTWAMVARYAVAAAIHGVPRVFMGQPLALAGKLPFRQSRSDMYGAGTADDPLRTPVADLYCRIDAAREEAPEARLLSRYFLKTGPAGGIGPSG